MKDIPVGVIKIGPVTPQIEVELAFMTYSVNWDSGQQHRTPRTDHDLAQMAWGLLEKDRYDMQGLNIEDCLGYQLGIRNPMVGDVIGITRAGIERFVAVAGTGFLDITVEQGAELLNMPSERRTMHLFRLEGDR